MITIGLKMVWEPKKMVTSVSLDHELSDPEKKFEKSYCSVAQVHHHEQVGVGGHLAALASHGEVIFIQNF